MSNGESAQMTSLRERYALLQPLILVPTVFLLFATLIDSSFFNKIIESFLITIPLTIYVITTKIEPNRYIYGLFNLLYFIAVFVLVKNNINNKLLTTSLYIYSVIQGFLLLLVVVGRWC